MKTTVSEMWKDQVVRNSKCFISAYKDIIYQIAVSYKYLEAKDFKGSLCLSVKQILKNNQIFCFVLFFTGSCINFQIVLS